MKAALSPISRYEIQVLTADLRGPGLVRPALEDSPVGRDLYDVRGVTLAVDLRDDDDARSVFGGHAAFGGEAERAGRRSLVFHRDLGLQSGMLTEIFGGSLKGDRGDLLLRDALRCPLQVRSRRNLQIDTVRVEA